MHTWRGRCQHQQIHIINWAGSVTGLFLSLRLSSVKRNKCQLISRHSGSEFQPDGFPSWVWPVGLYSAVWRSDSLSDVGSAAEEGRIQLIGLFEFSHSSSTSHYSCSAMNVWVYASALWSRVEVILGVLATSCLVLMTQANQIPLYLYSMSAQTTVFVF